MLIEILLWVDSLPFSGRFFFFLLLVLVVRWMQFESMSSWLERAVDLISDCSIYQIISIVIPVLKWFCFQLNKVTWLFILFVGSSFSWSKTYMLPRRFFFYAFQRWGKSKDCRAFRRTNYESILFFSKVVPSDFKNTKNTFKCLLN